MRNIKFPYQFPSLKIVRILQWTQVSIKSNIAVMVTIKYAGNQNNDHNGGLIVVGAVNKIILGTSAIRNLQILSNYLVLQTRPDFPLIVSYPLWNSWFEISIREVSKFSIIEHQIRFSLSNNMYIIIIFTLNSECLSIPAVAIYLELNN